MTDNKPVFNEMDNLLKRSKNLPFPLRWSTQYLIRKAYKSLTNPNAKSLLPLMKFFFNKPAEQRNTYVSIESIAKEIELYLSETTWRTHSITKKACRTALILTGFKINRKQVLVNDFDFKILLEVNRLDSDAATDSFLKEHPELIEQIQYEKKFFIEGKEDDFNKLYTRTTGFDFQEAREFELSGQPFIISWVGQKLTIQFRTPNIIIK